MKTPPALLLTGTAVLAILAAQAPSRGASTDHPSLIAQNEKPGAQPENGKPARRSEPETKRSPAAEPRQQNQAHPSGRSELKPESKPTPAQERAAPQQRSDERQRSRAGEENARDREQRGEHREQRANPPTAQERRAPQEKQEKQEKREKQEPAAAQKQNNEQKQKSEPQQKSAPAAAAPKKPEESNKAGRKEENANERRNVEQNERQQKPAAEKAPQAQPEKRQAQPEKPPAQPEKRQAQPENKQPPAPAASSKPTQNEQRNANAPAAAPVKPRDASEFIVRKGEKPTQTLDQLRKERHETREGNRVIIQEGDRTIVHSDNRVIIRHNEAQRFAIGARDVHVDHRNGEMVTVIERPNGVRIVNITDADGHLIRRLRRDRDGREVVIIDDSFARERRPDVDVYVDLPPVEIRDRDRYFIDAGRASPEQVYAVFTAPPVVRVDKRYTVDQVRYSYPLRERMPRVELDINFDTGSWQITPDQIDRLKVIADGLNRAIDKNPREVFLIEGHTDAVGSAEDNLSLSDRRAEAVAVALTEQFHVPPENLLTQGYGEQHLKVQTEGPSRENRRVDVLRITPLIDQQAQNAPR